MLHDAGIYLTCVVSCLFSLIAVRRAAVGCGLAWAKRFKRPRGGRREVLEPHSGTMPSSRSAFWLWL